MHQTHHKKVPASKSRTKSESLQDDASSDTRQPPRHDITPQRPRSTTSIVELESPTLPQQPITTPVSHLDDTVVIKFQDTWNKHFQGERGVFGPVAASGWLSRPGKINSVQQHEHAKIEQSLQVVAPRHRQPPTKLPSFVIPSFPIDPFLSRSLLPPIFRATETSTTGASAINEAVQSRDLVPLNYFKEAVHSKDLVPLNSFKDGKLVPSGNSIKVDTSSPDHKERLQQDDTVATRGGPFNPMEASDPAASEESISGYRSTTRVSSVDCNHDSREPSPDGSSEDIDTWREHFLLELIKTPYGPSEKEVRDRIQFFRNPSGMTQAELDEARKQYERVCYRQCDRSLGPFEIDGRPETYQLDRIKCWVNFNMHLIGTPPVWPKDYDSVCTKKELLDAGSFAQDDDAVSEYTIESVTASNFG